MLPWQQTRFTCKHVETLSLCRPESNMGILYFYSCCFMLLGVCGGTLMEIRSSQPQHRSQPEPLGRGRSAAFRFSRSVLGVRWQETWRGLKTTKCPNPRMFTGWWRHSQRSPGRRTPYTGSHLDLAHVHRPQIWRLTPTPCCGHSPAGRKPGWSLTEGAS